LWGIFWVLKIGMVFWRGIYELVWVWKRSGISGIKTMVGAMFNNRKKWGWCVDESAYPKARKSTDFCVFNTPLV
jgi:hypothetical protein